MFIRVKFLISDYGEDKLFNSRQEIIDFFPNKVLEFRENIIYCKYGDNYLCIGQISEEPDNFDYVTNLIKTYKKDEYKKILEIMEKPKIDLNQVNEEMYGKDYQKLIITDKNA